MLTEDQVNEYHEKGFVILDYKMPENDLEEIKSYHQVLLEKHPEFRDYCPTLLKYNLDFLKYAKKPEILNCVKQVIGTNLAIWNQSFFAKPGINGKATPWHQDGEYWPIRPLATCTVWLAVDDSNEENGCLKYIPGSHKRKATRKHSTNNSSNLTLNQSIYGKEKTYNKKLFDKALSEGKVVVVSSWIKYCTSCASQMKVLEKAKNDFDNMEYFAFDVTNKEIAKFFNVQYQTTLLIFKDNKEVYRSIGETTKELIYDALKSSI